MNLIHSAVRASEFPRWVAAVLDQTIIHAMDLCLFDESIANPWTRPSDCCFTHPNPWQCPAMRDGSSASHAARKQRGASIAFTRVFQSFAYSATARL
jgi:hypothetical protein